MYGLWSGYLNYLLRLLFLCFYERKLEVWDEKKIGRLVTTDGILVVWWCLDCRFFSCLD